MYKKVSTDLNFVDREKQTEKFWEDNDIFRKSMRDREGNEIYMFYDGPPTANGKPHIGTRSDTCYQGYDSKIPHNERIRSSKKGRMGYTRTSL